MINRYNTTNWMIRQKFLLLALLLVFGLSSSSQNLEDHFFRPPHSAKPITWMHVMSGNMSKEGMTKDLEAIADAGIGGIILFNVTHNIPNGPVDFNSPEHIEMTAHAAAECERLGLSFGIHNCDGWTSSGGPWVPVAHSMKQVVYRHVIVGGGDVDMFLPGGSKCGGFYKDIAVIAYPALQSEIADAENQPIITSSNPDFDVNIATNGKIDERTELTVSQGETGWIQWDFDQPQTMRSFLLKSENQRTKITGLMLKKGEQPRKARFYLETSEDGITFKKVKELRILRHGKYEYTIDDSFEGITSRYFRFVTDMALDIEEVNLSATYRFDNMTSRISIHRANNGSLRKLDDPGDEWIIKKQEIIDLSNKVDENGKLITKLPEGKWTIMRVGYTTTKAINDPASIVGTGLEVDKFSRKSFKLFYEGYVRNVIDASREIAPNALRYVEIDSYEVGSQNWTDGYEKQFKDYTGYDILDFLPLYAGRYVEDAETTEGVLWDLRNFNSQLMTENYFDYFSELCHQDGLKSYVEPYGNATFNTLDAARMADIPMGEFHASGRLMIDQAVSAGHIYGKNIISAEAFTSGPGESFKGHPGAWKLTGDIAWANGINEICFHRFTHQPNTHVTPGMTMSGFGSNIDRTQTWWDNAGKAWFEYLARGQYLLRRGVPVADILVFVGDGSPNTTVSRKGLKDLPNSINYDCVNSDVLFSRITVANGKLMLPEGTRYHALYLTNSRELHLSTIRRLAELAEEGVIIIGNRPIGIGGYMPGAEERMEFEKLVETIWAKPTTIPDASWEEIYQKFNLSIDLKIEGGEDISYMHRKSETEDIFFFYNPESTKRTFECTFNIDSKLPEWFDPMTGKSYPLAAFEHHDGKTKTVVTIPAEGSGFVVFRQSSAGINSLKVSTALENPDLAFRFNDDRGITVKSGKAGEYELNFADNSNRTIQINDIHEPMIITGSWKVTFSDLKSGPKTLTFSELADWTTHDLEEVKHYSGTAIYEQSFKLSKDVLSQNGEILLDLGEVREIARVTLNGKDLGVIWKSPHEMDISSALKAGKNDLRIEITNQWTNRLIGDENFPNLTGYDLRPQLNRPLPARDPQMSLINQYKMVEWYVNNEPAPLGKRSTFVTYPFYEKGDKLLPAGLIGPVRIKSVKNISIK